MTVASLGRVCEAEIMMMLMKCRVGIRWHSWQGLAKVAQLAKLAQLAAWLPLDHAQMPIYWPTDDTLGAQHTHKRPFVFLITSEGTGLNSSKRNLYKPDHIQNVCPKTMRCINRVMSSQN